MPIFSSQTRYNDLADVVQLYNLQVKLFWVVLVWDGFGGPSDHYGPFRQ